MKKILALALAMMMVLTLAACGGKTDPTPSGSDTQQTDPGTSQQEQPINTPEETTPSDSNSGEQPDVGGLNEEIKKWPDNEYTQQIPKPTSGALVSTGDIVAGGVGECEGGCSASIMQFSEDDFSAYAESCLSDGWVKVEGSDAFNATKGDYSLAITYLANTYQGLMGITVIKP